MSSPCPFCGFKASDFRESYNWCCSECGKDYADWLLAQKANASSRENSKNAQKPKPLFSAREIPPEAEPVKFAQSLFVLVCLLFLGLNFVYEDTFSWFMPVCIPLVGYYAFTIYKTGYALGQYYVYSREKNPIMYKVHLWGAIGFMFLVFGAWVT